MPQTKIQGKFYPLTKDVTARLRQAKLTAAEWRIWSYLVEIDPWGDRYQDIDSLDVISKCDCSRATFYRAIAKFQKLKIFDFQDQGFCIRNLTGASKLKSSQEENQDTKFKKDNLKNEKFVSKMRLDSQNCESDLKNEKFVSKMRLDSQNCENQTLKPLPDKALNSPQTIQTYSDFKRSLSEGERENFFNFVKDQTNNLERPINDLEAWLASKNAAKQNRWEIYYKNYQEEKIGQSAKANKHNQDLASSTLAQQKQALHKFHERLKRNSNSNEPEDNNSEEYQQSLAELNQLLNNPPEFGSSLFKKKAAEEAAKRQARLEQLEQETLLLMADPERLDSLLEEDQRLRRQIDARNSKDESEDLSVLQETDPELYRALNPERNPEINPEDLENE